MDAAAIATIINAISNVIVVAAPVVIDGAVKAQPFAKAIYDMFRGLDLTDEQINELLARANALSNQIQSPDFIPPEQSDDV